MTGAPSLRVASYNIRKAIGLDRRRDPTRVLEVLRTLDADIIALQEADRRLGDRPSALPRDVLASDLGYQVADLARTAVSLGWHGNAILVRRGLTILATHHIELPALEPRGAVLVEIATAIGPVQILGTHLGLLRPWRQRQLARIRSALDGPRVARSLVLGDLNEWSRTKGLEILDAAFDMIEPGASFPAWRPVATLDRIAVGSELACLGSGVLAEGPARVASDHLPVWAEISARQTPAP